MPALYAVMWGQALEKESVIVTSLPCSDSNNTDTFLDQLIQFCSHNATNLHHLTLHGIRRVAQLAPQHRGRIVTSLHPMYSCNAKSFHWQAQLQAYTVHEHGTDCLQPFSSSAHYSRSIFNWARTCPGAGDWQHCRVTSSDAVVTVWSRGSMLK